MDLSRRGPGRRCIRAEIFAPVVALLAFACGRLQDIAVMPFTLKRSATGRIIGLVRPSRPKRLDVGVIAEVSGLDVLDLVVAQRFRGSIAIGLAHVAPIGFFPTTDQLPVKALVVRKQSLFNKLLRLRRLSDIIINLTPIIYPPIILFIAFHHKH